MWGLELKRLAVCLPCSAKRMHSAKRLQIGIMQETKLSEIILDQDQNVEQKYNYKRQFFRFLFSPNAYLNIGFLLDVVAQKGGLLFYLGHLQTRIFFLRFFFLVHQPGLFFVEGLVTTSPKKQTHIFLSLCIILKRDSSFISANPFCPFSSRFGSQTRKIHPRPSHQRKNKNT